MGHRITAFAFGAAVLLASAQSVCADPEECQDALDAYNSAKSALDEAKENYAMCTEDTSGHEDCSMEFSELRSAQEEYESAVSRYRMDCG